MSVFLLFQTDSWKSKASRVFFGAFDSRTKALDYAKYNDLYWYNSEVVVVEVVLNQFGEVYNQKSQVLRLGFHFV
jgi:hypothetical protein